MIDALTLVILLIAVHAAVTLWSVRTAKREDWFFIVPAILIWISSLSITAWDFIKLQECIFKLSTVSVLGLILFITGLIIRIAAKRTLRQNYSRILNISEDHRLIKHGVYKYIRHPIYLGAMLYTPGIPLLFSSMYGSIIMMALIPFLIYRIGIEEEMLIEEFGDEYREYMDNTKKLIPYIY